MHRLNGREGHKGFSWQNFPKCIQWNNSDKESLIKDMAKKMCAVPPDLWSMNN